MLRTPRSHQPPRMTVEEFQALLSRGEGQGTEFKEEAIKPGDLAQTFVALANAQGGVMLLGVTDDAKPVGIRSYQSAYDLVMTAAGPELCDPPVRLSQVGAVDLPDGRQVLAVTVPRSRRLHATHGRFLIRRGSQNVSLTTAEVAHRSQTLETDGLTPLLLGGGYQALYEVLSFEATLTLLDPRGELARLERDQTVRFLQDGVVGLYHQVWGDGELFDDYQVEPGVVADRFKVGERQITVISLRQIHNRGDRLRLQITRRIKKGWTSAEGWLELAVNHRTTHFRLTVVFPPEWPPQRAFLTAQLSGATRELPARSWQTDDQGRTMISCQKRRPDVGERYLLRWEW